MRVALKELSRQIRRAKISYDFIVGRGLSGSLIAAPLALRLNKRLVVVRKGEETHSWCKIEGLERGMMHSYIIVDDFISTGETVRAIIDAMEKNCSHSKCQGIFLYGAAKKYEDIFVYGEREIPVSAFCTETWE